MFARLGYYYRLTNEIIRLNAKSTIEYKIDFIMYIVLQILYLLLSYFFIDLFVSKVQNIGLTTNEFYFYALLIDCVYSFFLNYPSMYYLISSGQIEVNLVKPVNIIYFLYLRYLSVRSLILFCFKTVFLIIFGIYLGVNPVFVFIVLIFTTIASTLLFQSFYYLVISFDFLKIELGRFIFDILSERHFRSFAQNYPIYFFPRIIITYMFFMPVLYIANVGLNLLSEDIFTIVILILTELILGIVFFYFAQLAWKKALKKYEGFGG